MNQSAVTRQVSTSSRCIKLKELLNRFNLNYEERIDGNTVVIDIKARPLLQKNAQQLIVTSSTAEPAIL